MLILADGFQSYYACCVHGGKAIAEHLSNRTRPATNLNSQSSPLQLRTRDIWQKGCAPLNPAKA